MADTDKKKKKLPFKPTALRRAPKPSQSDEEKKSDADDLALFRRRKEMEPIMAQDRERRQRRKQRREEEEERRRAVVEGKRPRASTDEEEQTRQRSSSRSREASQQVRQESEDLYGASPVGESMTVTGESCSKLATPPPSKRCRVGSTPSSKRPSASVEPTGSSLEASPSARRLQRQQYLSPSKPLLRHESFTASNAPIISLDSDSEEDEDVKPTFPPARNRSPSMEILDGDSPLEVVPEPEPEAEEDEFAEYIRRAETQRARHQVPLDISQDDTLKKENTEIFISSPMPNAHPVVFKFLFNKELRLARKTWIAIQAKNGNPIPANQHDDVVLTWRRRRVYNSSCLFDLGIRPLGDGRLATTSQGKEGLAKERTRVHMEAWTQEAFQQMELEQELQRKRDAGEISDIEEEPAEEAEEIKLRIILKARDLEPVKLTIRPETTVETLLTGFRSQRQIGSDRDVSLSFDGEILEEHVTMDEAEIDDMDTIDVYIK